MLEPWGAVILGILGALTTVLGYKYVVVNIWQIYASIRYLILDLWFTQQGLVIRLSVVRCLLVHPMMRL